MHEPSPHVNSSSVQGRWVGASINTGRTQLNRRNVCPTYHSISYATQSFCPWFLFVHRLVTITGQRSSVIGHQRLPVRGYKSSDIGHQSKLLLSLLLLSHYAKNKYNTSSSIYKILVILHLAQTCNLKT